MKILKKDRPKILREIPLPVPMTGGTLIITINVGAWDALIAAVWDKGGILIEMENDRPVRAFQRDVSIN
jgi:hypothetical protein